MNNYFECSKCGVYTDDGGLRNNSRYCLECLDKEFINMKESETEK